VGTQSPLATIHISASDGLIIPVGNTNQRSSNAIKGEIRFNDQLQSYEGYDGNNWGSLGGMTDVDQDTKITAEDSAGDDNDQLKFFTAGTERLRIFADGHISASGNITASSNLRVDGDLIVSGLTNPNISDFSSSLHGKITSITSSISALKTNSGSFSLRETNLETTSSALINNFDQIQSLGKTDSVVFSNITASNNTQLAGNVLMQSELNILGNITASGNISSSKSIIAATGSFGFFTIEGDFTAEIGTFTELKVGESIELGGRTLANHISYQVDDAWQKDSNDDYMPADDNTVVVDPKFGVDEEGNVYPRSNELWTDDVHTYFE